MTSTVAAAHRTFAVRSHPAQLRMRARARRTAWVEILALALVALALAAAVMVSRTGTGRPMATELVRVERGTSLWTLAREHPVDGLSTEQTTRLIASLNHLDRYALPTGATVRVPTRISDTLSVAWR